MICRINNCSLLVSKKLLCNKHYIRFRKYGDFNAEHRKTHGLKKDNKKLYGVWSSMKGRCLSLTHQAYQHYGARGIIICDDWLDFKNFYNWAYTSNYKSGLSLDRIDNNKGYSSENCRWTSQKVQNNNKSNNRIIEYNGQIKNLMQWSEQLNINYYTLHVRLERGWDIKKVMTTPTAYKINKVVCH